MELKEKIHNLIILDESGSMHSIKDQIIGGFNEIVQTIKGVAKEYPEQEHFITFLSFNRLKKTIHLETELVSKLKEINGANYNPNAGTPLFDAMGFGINRLREKIKNEPQANVLVTILTDGMENASKEYNGTAIKALVEEMENEKWTFTYIGADHNVDRFAKSISIKNSITFRKDRVGINQLFKREKDSRIRYSKRIKERLNTKDNYYAEED